MKLLRFGQPDGGVVQTAFVVPDIGKAMADYSFRLGIGPWFVTGPFTPPDALYRGRPAELTITLAVTFAGHMMIELIQQHSPGPSVFSEVVAERGYGFHHMAVACRDFDDAVERYRAKGYEVVFSDRSPRGVRVVYVDARHDLPGMLEIIEMTEALEARYTEMYEACLAFDGTDPIRR